MHPPNATGSVTVGDVNVSNGERSTAGVWAQDKMIKVKYL